MMADGLTKDLTRQKHTRFLDQLDMIDLREELEGLADAQEDDDNRNDGNLWLSA